MVSDTGAVPTWDLPWNRSVSGLSRIWALLFIVSFVWGPRASQVMSGPRCGCSASLFLHTPWGKQGDRDGDPPRLSATFGLVVGGRELSDPRGPAKIPFLGC